MEKSGKENILSTKILIVGDSRVGKSSLILRFTENIFQEHPATTVGVEYKPKIVKIENVDMKLQIWDTAGQEKFRSVALSFYKGAKGAILIFDLTNPESLDHLNHWHRQLRLHAGEDIVKVLVGTKSDLESVIPEEKIEEIREDFDVTFFKVSSKLNVNVNECFDFIATNIKKRFYNAAPNDSLASPIISSNINGNQNMTFKLEKGKGKEVTESNSTCC